MARRHFRSVRYCSRCGATFLSMTRCPRDNIAVGPGAGDPMLGAVLGQRYRVLERIGAGGMGQVYRAAHVRIASQFAVKILYGDLALDPQMRARFEREAEAASCLQSRHIVRVVDFGETEHGITYLVMEMLAGELLADAIAKSGMVDPARTVRIARQIARGLRHAHERGIVHRDLKPENVMLVAEDDDEEIVKLLDFGIARIVERKKLTQVVGFIGSPAYGSPEQIAGWEIDARTDLYSLGVILFEMLAGAPPFWGDSLVEIFRMHQQEPPPALKEMNPQCAAPPELEGIVRRLLEKNPDHRFASARSLIDALDDVDAAVAALSPRKRDTAVLDAPVTSIAPTLSLPVSRLPAACVDAIQRAIMRGAPLYNAGDVEGCAGLYRRTAEELAAGPLGASGQEALRARLLAAVRRADPNDAAQAAWELRYAFDDLLASADRLGRLAVDASARPPALADVPDAARDLAQLEAAAVLATPRYLAGHTDTVAAFYLELGSMLRDRWLALGRGVAAVAILDEALGAAASGPGSQAAAVLESAFERLRKEAPAPVAAHSHVGVAASPYLEEVVDALVHAISVGAPTYNAGDIDGCARLYLQTAERLVERLGRETRSSGLRALLEQAVSQARGSSADGAAWTLRRAFDAILEEAYGASSPG